MDSLRESSINDLCTIIDCEHKTAPYIEKSDYLVVRTNNVKNGRLNYEGIKYTTAEGYAEWTKRGTPNKGDVFFTREAPTGETSMVPEGGQLCMGQRMVLLRPDSSKVVPQFLALFLLTDRCKYDIYRFSIGSTVQRINISDIKKIKIFAPSILEQTKIAQVLLTWDQAIETTEKLIENSKAQKKALMQQLLTGKKRLPGFSAEWQQLKASEIFKTVSIKKTPDEQLLSVTQDQGVLPRSLLERKVVMPDGSTSGYKLVVPGNFIISLRSFQGGLEYSEYQGLVSPAYTVLEPIEDISDRYYRQYYKSYEFIGRLAVAVIGIRDGKQISYSDFSFLKLPYPPLDEQEAIAAVLDTSDAEINNLKSQLDNLSKQKKALMQQLLTGKRRVKIAP